MIIQKLKGGLGNQMSQYAFAKSLSLKNKIEFKLDISFFENYKLHKYCLEFFNIEKKYSSKNETPFLNNYNSKNKYINIIISILKGLLKSLNHNHYLEKGLQFNPNFLNIKSGYVDGYFQTEKYFLDFENDIRNDFEFIIEPSKKNKETIELINNCNSVSLHIRRGDYITNPNANSFHGTCNLDYYKKAISIITEKIKNPIFFLFSDDIEWVKENLKMNNESHYIDWNNAETNYEDMRQMSLCKHNIIANSSFSWWGAWLNKNKEKIVIAPSKWFNDANANCSDIVPDKWIKI